MSSLIWEEGPLGLNPSGHHPQALLLGHAPSLCARPSGARCHPPVPLPCGPPRMWSPSSSTLSKLSSIQQFLAEDPTPSPKHQLAHRSASINEHLAHARTRHASRHRNRYTEKQGGPPAAALGVAGATCSSDGLGGRQGCIPPGLEARHGLCSFLRE